MVFQLTKNNSCNILMISNVNYLNYQKNKTKLKFFFVQEPKLSKKIGWKKINFTKKIWTKVVFYQIFWTKKVNTIFLNIRYVKLIKNLNL
jgi:hypothetical protein